MHRLCQANAYALHWGRGFQASAFRSTSGSPPSFQIPSMRNATANFYHTLRYSHTHIFIRTKSRYQQRVSPGKFSVCAWWGKLCAIQTTEGPRNSHSNTHTYTHAHTHFKTYILSRCANPMSPSVFLVSASLCQQRKQNINWCFSLNTLAHNMMFEYMFV